MTDTSLTPQPTSSTRRRLSDEGRRAAAEVVALVRTCHPRGWGIVQTTIALTLLFGVAGDAFTTIAMMSTGLFEEANPAAAAGMEIVGVVPYVLAASVVSIALMTPALGQPAGLYAWAAWSASSVILAVKVYTVANNLGLWSTVAFA